MWVICGFDGEEEGEGILATKATKEDEREERRGE